MGRVTSASHAVKKLPRILVLIDHYLPGTNTGGAVRTLAATVERLGDEFEFVVVTSDRDRGDTEPYPGAAAVPARIGKAEVHYRPSRRLRAAPLSALLRRLDPDVIFLNGFFSRTGVSTLLARRAGRVARIPVILAPRGDFSPGALWLKRYKKRPYVRFTRCLGLCRGITWQATNECEAGHIRSAFGGGRVADGLRIAVARDLVAGVETAMAAGPAVDAQAAIGRGKRPGAARIVFLSRISRKKNLDGAIRLLGRVAGEVEFDIYGPVEDAGYWRECLRLLDELPRNVRAAYRGPVEADRVSEVLSGYHLLLLPTKGENFGHVILEALMAGCPVLVSDETPWRGLAVRQVGWDFPLAAPECSRAALDAAIGMDAVEFGVWSENAARYGKSCAGDPAVVEANRAVFRQALDSGEEKG